MESFSRCKSDKIESIKTWLGHSNNFDDGVFINSDPKIIKYRYLVIMCKTSTAICVEDHVKETDRDCAGIGGSFVGRNPKRGTHTNFELPAYSQKEYL